MIMASLKRKKWRKILYEDQGVPDNYVDETFLDEMKKNLNIRTYDFWTVAKESGVVTQQISSLIVFVVVFVYMENEALAPQTLFAMSSGFAVIGYIIHHLLAKGQQSHGGRTWWDDLKTLIIFISFGFGLSPILGTLTETISTDTIYAMTFFMLLANLLFHDYGTDAAMVSQSLSLNAAIFASVCLASRLPTAWHSFATVTFAVEMFALWPALRTKLKHGCHNGLVWTTSVCVVMAVIALWSVSHVATILFSLAVFFITFVCPAWLIELQPYKNNIYGPWDEAIIKEGS